MFLLGKIRWNLDQHAGVQIALFLRMAQLGHSASVDADRLARLCPRRDAHFDLARQRINVGFPTQNRRIQTDLQTGVEVVVPALEVRIGLYGDDQIKIALCAASVACFTFTAYADARTISGTRRNPDRLFLATPVQDALRSLVGFFKRNLDRLFQVTPFDRLAIAFTSPPATENVREKVREIW